MEDIDKGLKKLEAEIKFSKLCNYSKLLMEFAFEDIKKDPHNAMETLNGVRLHIIERFNSHLSEIEKMSDPTDPSKTGGAGKDDGSSMDFQEEEVTTKESAEEMVAASRRNSQMIDAMTEEQRGERKKRKISYLLGALNAKK